MPKSVAVNSQHRRQRFVSHPRRFSSDRKKRKSVMKQLRHILAERYPTNFFGQEQPNCSYTEFIDYTATDHGLTAQYLIIIISGIPTPAV